MVVAVLASSPFAVRYATEVRMYGLLLVLLLVLHLVVVSTWERPSRGRAGAVAVVVAAVLLTHYWALFAVTVLGIGTLASRRVDRGRGKSCRRRGRRLSGLRPMESGPDRPDGPYRDTVVAGARPTVVVALALEA
ncbi:MAG: hypothetical protein Ct9H300mP12_04690 [Acidimicrobiales bacterium]|nr:MAG: hypothetical protein Ct9H300mP12_04690 [Acidimicrobiales bacterium]